jgi:predicted permease
MNAHGGPGDSRGPIRDEIQFHLEMRVRELRDSGLDESEARRVALEAFGDPRRVESAVARVDDSSRRRRWMREAVASVAHDTRYALRFVVGNPGFAAVAIATLALGIGATTAMYSLTAASLLRRPAVADPGSLVAVYTTCRLGEPRCSSSYPDYLDYRDRTASLADLAASTGLPASLGDEERGARLLQLEAVSGNYFGLLGLGAELGRPLQPADDEGAAPVAVLSHDLWRDQFGADEAIIGATVRLNGTPFEVVGVAPEEYRGLTLGSEPELWIPLRSGSAIGAGFAVSQPGIWEQRSSRWIGRLVGRLAPDATVEQARAELFAVSERLREEGAAARGPRSITVDPLGTYLLPAGAEESLPSFVWLLLGTVAATLLLACANLANLMLARATTRTAEMGVRVAIGAGRGRLVRQLLAESLLLSSLGAVVGLGLAGALMRSLGAFDLPGGVAVGALGGDLDTRVLAFTAALAILTAMLCGLAPALQSTRRDVVAALRAGRSPEGRRGSAALRRSLVATQIALCVVLLVGSGLFIRSLRGALALDPGFRPEGVAALRFHPALLRYAPEETLALSAMLRERVRALPDVSTAAVATLVPFLGDRSGTFTQVDGYQPAPDEEMRIDRLFVSPSYMETLGIPLVEGREFDDGDAAGAQVVAIVNRSMAEKYWPGGRAVGGVLQLAGPGGARIGAQVVGIAEDVQWSGLRDEPTNFVFFPHAQFAGTVNGTLTLVARTRSEAHDLLPALAEALRGIDADLSPQTLTTMETLVGDLLMPQRMGATLLSGFGLLAALLAALGIAGVVSYGVREQRRAIGVRLALGATGAQVVRGIARWMALPVVVGLAAGIAAAALLDDAVERFLYGVVPGDPLTYATIVVALTIVATTATLLPAREATRVDPLQALRSD